MNLTWHIVKKDLRRMGPTAAVWLGLMAAVALVVRLAEIPNEVVLGGDVRAWVNQVRIVQGLLGGAGAVLAVLVVAQLVQEDGLLGAEAMWLTRPITPGRLLAAKLLGAALMLIAAPVAVMGPIWLASGFSMAELVGATASVAISQAAMMAVALSVAAMARDLGQFVFGLVGLTLLVVARLALAGDGGASLDVREARVVILQILVPLAVVAAGGVQFLTRKTRRARVILGGGLAVAVAVSLVWPWGNLADWGGRLGNWPRGNAEAGARPLKIGRIGGSGEAHAPMTIFWHTGPVAARDEFVMVVNGGVELRRAQGAAVRASVEPGRWWGEMAAKRMLGLAPNAGPLATTAELRLHAPVEWSAMEDSAGVSGELRLARVRARVMGEWPWRIGAGARVGSSATRVVGIREWKDEARGAVQIEERDALPGALVNVWAQDRGDGAVRRDYFALVNRRLGIFQTMRVVESGAVQANGLLLAERSLEYDMPKGAGADWARDAVIVKVRFDVLERWTTMLDNERVGAAGPRKNL